CSEAISKYLSVKLHVFYTGRPLPPYRSVFSWRHKTERKQGIPTGRYVYRYAVLRSIIAALEFVGTPCLLYAWLYCLCSTGHRRKVSQSGRVFASTQCPLSRGWR